MYKPIDVEMTITAIKEYPVDDRFSYAVAFEDLSGLLALFVYLDDAKSYAKAGAGYTGVLKVVDLETGKVVS